MSALLLNGQPLLAHARRTSKVACAELASPTLASMYRERWTGATGTKVREDSAGLETTIQLLERAVQNSSVDQELANTQLPGSEACLLIEEEVCGPTSFDSTDLLTCVETYIDGQLRWVCD